MKTANLVSVSLLVVTVLNYVAFIKNPMDMTQAPWLLLVLTSGVVGVIYILLLSPLTDANTNDFFSFGIAIVGVWAVALPIRYSMYFLGCTLGGWWIFAVFFAIIIAIWRLRYTSKELDYYK